MTHWGIQQQIKKTNSRHPADSSDHLRFANNFLGNLGAVARSERHNSIHKIKGFSRIHPKKFTQASPKTWEDEFLGIPFPASTREVDGRTEHRTLLLKQSLSLRALKKLLFAPVTLGRPRFVPRTNLFFSGIVPFVLHSGSPICPWHTPGGPSSHKNLSRLFDK